MQMVMRVLIVDDNIMMRQMLTAQMNSMGYADITTAINGMDAMNQLLDSYKKCSPFNLLLLDWNMPEMNGLEFLGLVRKDKHFNETAIIMTTAQGEQKNIMKAIEAGATSYLVKPFSPQVFKEKIEHVVEWLSKIKGK